MTMSTTMISEIWKQFDELKMDKNPEKEKNTNECRECDGTKTYNAERFLVCTKCGLIDETSISEEPEWNSGVNEDGTTYDACRVGMPSDTDLFSDKWGAGTVMSTKGCNYQWKRLGTINFHGSMNHQDRALYHAYNEIEEICKNKLKLPDVVTRNAKTMYRHFNEKKLTRGAIRKGIKANCVFYSCKIEGISLTTKEIAEPFEIPTRDMSRTSDMFKDIVDNFNKSSVKKSKSTKPIDVIYRLLNSFDTSETFTRDNYKKINDYCTHLLKCVQLMGKTPTSIASVIILKILGSQVSKHEVAENCNISLPTLVKIEKIVNKYLEECPINS